MKVRIRQGLDVPVAGAPAQQVESARRVGHVALCGPDYIGLKPQLRVAEGDAVRAGEPLFVDRRDPAVNYTAPGSGTVVAVRRGARRALQAVVIRLAEGMVGADVPAGGAGASAGRRRDAVAARLTACGVWTAFRTRPFGRVPSAAGRPAAIFVTAIDTQPLAADPPVVVRPRMREFEAGLRAIGVLTEGTVWLCTGPGWDLGAPDLPRLRHVIFEGPHPAGLAGTHIHHLHAAGPARPVWHIGYQDVIAIGALFTRGVLDFRRVIAIGGDAATRPRLLGTRLGAALDELLAGELVADADVRLVSGSILSGSAASAGRGFLGRYHLQVTALREAGSPRPFAWLRPGVAGIARRPRHTTALNGRVSGMLPLELFDRLLPAGFLAIPLLRALLAGDVERARALGCLELDEEDLALSAFACPAKCDYPAALRHALARIEAEG